MASSVAPHESHRSPSRWAARGSQGPALCGGKSRAAGMRLGRYRFQPSLWPSLAVLLLLPLLLGLGFWQLDRAEQKRAWLAQLERAAQQDALDLNASQP